MNKRNAIKIVDQNWDDVYESILDGWTPDKTLEKLFSYDPTHKN